MRIALLAAIALLLVPIAGSAAGHTEFRFRDMLSFVSQIDIEQISPMKRTYGYVVNPRRTETRYVIDPMGRFEIRGTVYIAGRRDKIKPIEVTIRPGSVVTIVLDEVGDAFSLTATSNS